MLLLTLDEKSRSPKQAQIVQQIRRKIESRALQPGDKLPSTRKLGRSLAIHRSTVALAYQELWALGFIDMRPGMCPRVRERMKVVTPTNQPQKGVVHWSRVASPATNDIWQTHRWFESDAEEGTAGGSIDFRSLDMDARLFPTEHFRSCATRAMRQHGAAILGYGDRNGFLPLREWIAGRLQNHGICVNAEELLITNGAQHGIDLVLRMVGAPGRTIALESPTYHYLPPLIRFLGLKAVEIPLLDDGMDLDALSAILRRKRPALVYTMPSFQNPTGLRTTQLHREKLLSLCMAHGVPILEDGFEEEMTYSGPVVLPVKSMDTKRLVIYSGTFSKVLFPGVRIGWIAADKACVERLVAIRRFSDIFPNSIVQAAMYEFCADGYYDRHVARMHRVFRRRMEVAIEALRRHIPPQWARWTEPAGGFLIWLELAKAPPVGWSTHFTTHGVKVLPGRYFFASAPRREYVRLSISTLSEEEIVEGIQRLGRALAAAHGRRTVSA